MLTKEQVESESKRGRDGKKNRRGSAKNTARLDAFKNGGGKGGASWETCNCDLLHAVVVGVSGLGGAVTFGLSRDRGAHFLTLLLDDSKATLWFNGDADLNEELEAVLVKVDDL